MRVYAAVGSAGSREWCEAAVKVYCAWSGPRTQYENGLAQAAPPLRVLISYAYDQGKVPFYETMAANWALDDTDVMLDSGAFTAWTMDKQVVLKDLIAWVQDRRERFGNCEVINLDVIPGSHGGTMPTKRERDRGVKKSMANADAIRAEGIPVMEVFHLFEPWSVFEKLWERRQPGEIIGIGGIAGQAAKGNREMMREFGDNIFARVKDWSGGWNGIVPIHGLGASPDSWMGSRYPWWSIDSSSWTIFHRFGREIRRDGRNQKFSTERGKTSVRSVSDLYYIRVVERWRRLEETYTELWRDRGVTFIERETA